VSKVPVINIEYCSDCETCLELCPEVFAKNRTTGLIEVQDMEKYPEEKIHEVISFCPNDCICFSENA